MSDYSLMKCQPLTIRHVGRKSGDCASGQDGINLKVRRKLTNLKNIYNLINWYYENKKCKITVKREQ